MEFMLVVLGIFGLCALGLKGYELLTQKGADSEDEVGALPPSGDVPRLPPASRQADDGQGRDGRYRARRKKSKSELLAPAEPEPPISFENFVRYCAARGIPDEPRENPEFWALVQRVQLDDPDALRAFFDSISNRHCKSGEDGKSDQYLGSRHYETLISSRALFVVASRGRSSDGETLVCLLDSTFFATRYLALRALGEVWPVSAKVCARVSEMVNYWCKDADEVVGDIQHAAKAALGSWRDEDPEGFEELTRSLLK